MVSVTETKREKLVTTAKIMIVTQNKNIWRVLYPSTLSPFTNNLQTYTIHAIIIMGKFLSFLNRVKATAEHKKMNLDNVRCDDTCNVCSNSN